ncbi:MAG: ROK family protein [Pseudomonadota bacterium]
MAERTRSSSPHRGTILVADIGGTSIKLGAARDGMPLDARQRLQTKLLRCAKPVETLAGILREFAHAHDLSFDATVLTLPGLIDTDFDHLLNITAIPELDGRPLASDLTMHLGSPVYLERDAVLLLEGERVAGAAESQDRVLGIFFGTGIGAAYVDAGLPFRGAGWALEIGHWPISHDGTTLEGLQPDRLEVHASGRTLETLANTHGCAVSDVFTTGATIPELQEKLDAVVRHQAFAVATAIITMSPALTILGGGVLEMRDYPLAQLKNLIQQRATLVSERPPRLVSAMLSWQATLYAAPAVVAQRTGGVSSYAQSDFNFEGFFHGRDE